MKMTPYSPFNRTYKYMCLQNQLIHNKNKRQVKGLVDSNLKIQNKCKSSCKTQTSGKFSNKSFAPYSSFGIQKSGRLNKQPLAIHKNSRFDSRRKQSIAQQNTKINRKISEAKCRVIPYKQTQKQFSNSVVYKGIAMKFDENSKNKELIYFPNTSLTSALANFDMSTSRYLCRPHSARKSKN